MCKDDAASETEAGSGGGSGKVAVVGEGIGD